MGLRTFFSNSDRDFNSENNNVSQVYTKKKCKKSLLSSMFHFAINIGGKSKRTQRVEKLGKGDTVYK
jgi:hypothetical protein